MDKYKKSKICTLFLIGKCAYGNNCKFQHIHPNQNQNIQMSNDNPQSNIIQNSNNSSQMQNKNICKYFLSGNCTKPNCQYFHGYGPTLQNVSFESAHNSKILNLVIINEFRFITCNINSFKIWVLQPSFTCSQETSVEGTISKLIFSQNKIILATQTDSMYVRY